MGNIPELIKTEFRLTNSQIARWSRDVEQLGHQVADLRDLPARVDIMPRVIAELVVELIDEHEKRRRVDSVVRRPSAASARQLSL
jgi:hypothetical protein